MIAGSDISQETFPWYYLFNVYKKIPFEALIFVSRFKGLQHCIGVGVQLVQHS